MSNRLQQINETLKRELGNIIIEISQENWGIINITNVQINPDLKHARVWIYGDDKTIDQLNNKVPQIRKILRPRITFKFIPNLTFIKEDESISRVEEILEKIK